MSSDWIFKTIVLIRAGYSKVPPISLITISQCLLKNVPFILHVYYLCILYNLLCLCLCAFYCTMTIKVFIYKK